MTVLASDNFTRANSADLGSAWDENTAETNPGGFDISGNLAVPQSLVGGDSSETNNSVTWPNDQYSKATFGATDPDGVGPGCGVICRSATAAITWYRLVGNASGYDFYRAVSGVYTNLANGTGTTFAAGDSIELRVATSGANCNWTLLKNGVSFASGTDTSPIASGRAGIAHSSPSAVASLSAWEGGSLSAAANTVQCPLM